MENKRRGNDHRGVYVKPKWKKQANGRKKMNALCILIKAQSQRYAY
jgi:hypothetical protein